MIEEAAKIKNNIDSKNLTCDAEINNKVQDGVYMQADIIDQLNTNQQSNMTLSSCSVITQSGSAVKINVT